MYPTLSTAGRNGGNFDPQQAASLLNQTTAQARRRLEPFPPWLLATRAVLALAAYGAIWLSVRGQHPYAHPTAAIVPVGIAVGVINSVAVVAVGRRASAGVAGRSRFRPLDIALMVAVWFGVFVVMAGLAGAGVSDKITYGLYPAAAPLIVGGLAWAGLMLARSDRRAAAKGLAAAVVGALSLLAGPAGAWLVAGVGCFVLLLVAAALGARRQRA
jgi:hypothetical protein